MGARIGRLDLIVRLGVLLDDDEACVAFDHVFDRRRLMSGEDDEAVWILPKPLVLRERHREDLDAPTVGALAHEIELLDGRRHLFLRREPLVDIAEENLVLRK